MSQMNRFLVPPLVIYPLISRQLPQSKQIKLAGGFDLKSMPGTACWEIQKEWKNDFTMTRSKSTGIQILSNYVS